MLKYPRSIDCFWTIDRFVANGKGVYGLRRDFILAGAESQLFSLK